MKDIFGREVKVGDTIAAGMAYNRSSVLRVGKVVAVKERRNQYRPSDGVTGWSVTVEWTHDGDRGNEYKWRKVEKSTILGDVNYSLAKFVILPDGFAEQFPRDVVEHP